MQCLNLFQKNGFKWINPKEFDINRYSNNSSTGCVLEVDLCILKNYMNYIIIIFWLYIK